MTEDDLTTMYRASRPGAVVLGRFLLRHALYEVLARSGTEMRVAELVRELRRSGYVTWRPPSRAVSDVLRTEVRHGRVRRTGRGRYRLAYLDRAHLRHVRRCLAELHRHPRNRTANGRSWEDRQPGAAGTPPQDGPTPARDRVLDLVNRWEAARRATTPPDGGAAPGP